MAAPAPPRDGGAGPKSLLDEDDDDEDEDDDDRAEAAAAARARAAAASSAALRSWACLTSVASSPCACESNCRCCEAALLAAALRSLRSFCLAETFACASFSWAIWMLTSSSVARSWSMSCCRLSEAALR